MQNFRITSCYLYICYVNTNLYSALGGTPSSYQLHFTIAAAKANHHSVSHQYEREPPSPRFALMVLTNCNYQLTASPCVLF